MEKRIAELEQHIEEMKADVKQGQSYWNSGEMQYDLYQRLLDKWEIKEKMTKAEKQKLEYMEFYHNGLHFECYKGGMIVTKNGEKVGQCFDVFTKFMPPKEDIIKFWEALSKMTKE